MFLAQLPVGVDHQVTEREIDSLLERAKVLWPRIDVQARDFASFLASRAAPSSAAIAEDLLLAFACGQGGTAAHSAFEQRYAGEIDAALGSMRLPATLADEVKQRLRTKLFLAQDDKEPRINSYAGRGSLRAWVRAVAVRSAIDLMREETSAEVPMEEAVLQVFAGAEASPEIQALKERFRVQVNEAFAIGFAALSPRQRNLLKQHFVHGLNIDRIGAMYSVHRVTAFRWITQAKVDVYQAARAHLEPLLGTDAEKQQHGDDLLRLLRSQIDLSLDRLLRTEA